MNRIVAGLLVVALAALVGWTVGNRAATTDPEPPGSTDVPVDVAPGVPSRSDQQAAKLARLSAQYVCNPQGLAPGVLPQHSVVKLPGKPGPAGIRLVSFDRGWEMHTGDRPGTLLAVCEL